MEIREKEVVHFVESWIKHLNSNILNKSDFVLEDVVHKCFEDKMMFDSWFRGYDVMN